MEPAATMLAICRQRTEACGITSRCTFHEGYLDSLPASDAFDAATCLLVSQFIMQQRELLRLLKERNAQPSAMILNSQYLAVKVLI